MFQFSSNSKDCCFQSTLLVWLFIGLQACGGGGDGNTGAGPLPISKERLPQTLVYMANDGVQSNGESELYAVDDDTTKHILLSPAIALNVGDYIYTFKISPDKQWVAYSMTNPSSLKMKDNFGLHVVAIGGGESLKVSDVNVVRYSSSMVIKDFDWSANSQQLVYSGFDGLDQTNVYMVNRDGTEHKIINGSLGSSRSVGAFNPQWSPDGRYVLQEVRVRNSGTRYDTYSSAINIYDANNTGPNSTRLVTLKSATITNVNWSPDSQRFSYTADLKGNADNQLFVVNLTATSHKQLTQASSYERRSRWAPDGRNLAYLDDDSGKNPVDMYMSAGDGSVAKQTLVYLSNLGRRVYDIKWSPDGKDIAYTADADNLGQRELYVVNLASGASQKISAPMITNGDVYQFDWPANGRYLAYIADQELDGFAELYVVKFGSDSFSKVSYLQSNFEVDAFIWSADSQRLLFSLKNAAQPFSTPNTLYVNDVNGDNLELVSQGQLSKILRFAY